MGYIRKICNQLEINCQPRVLATPPLIWIVIDGNQIGLQSIANTLGWQSIINQIDWQSIVNQIFGVLIYLNLLIQKCFIKNLQFIKQSKKYELICFCKVHKKKITKIAYKMVKKR